VTRLLGGSWWTGSFVELRLITDLSDQNNVNLGTLAWLSDRGKVRTLPGVHAKVYIFDNQAIVTSANLTETAFTKRREIGVWLSADESRETVEIFESWWAHEASEVSTTELERFRERRKFGEIDEDNDGAFKLRKLWELPDKPAPQLFDIKEAEKTGNYAQYLQKYRELARLYESKQRLWEDAPLYLEVDAFLNFLFHGGARPSEPFKGSARARSLTDESRDREVGTLARVFALWLQDRTDEKVWRMRRLSTVRRLLSEDKLHHLDMGGVEDVLDCIHAMGALPWPRMEFLRSGRNSIEVIRDAWSKLLFGDGGKEKRMERCQKQLYSFGPSSTQELLGCFYPDKYPLKNSNSDAGLRYLGYEV
jgi:hypothetical protein